MKRGEKEAAMPLSRNKLLTQRAKDLRNNMTSQERKLWYLFLSKYSIRFQRQKVINNFIVGFYCAKAFLVLELDRGHHFTDKGVAYDEDRTNALRKLGIDVIRFSNNDVDKKFEFTCQCIDAEIKKRMLNMEKRKVKFISKEENKGNT